MKRRTALPAAVAAVVLMAGCSDPVVGVPSPSPAGPTVAAADGGGAVVPVLQRLPATAATKTSIILIDGAALNTIAQRSGYADQQQDSGGRAKSETAWLDIVAVDNPCGTKLDATSGSLRSGAPGDSLSIELGADEKSGYLAVCHGMVDPAKLADSKLRGGTVTDRSVGSIKGYAVNGDWIGSSADGSTAYLTETDTPADLAQQAITGPALPEGSLAQDPGVRAVLDAAPHAAMIQMGTKLVASASYSAPQQVQAAFQQAVAQGGFQEAPVPEFGGYSWTPDGRLTGTAAFVTRYGSAEEAATAASIFSDVWKRLGVSKFDGAITEQNGPTVITRLAGVGPKTFAIQSGAMGEYPGFLARK